MEFSRQFHQTMVVLDHLVVLAARGLFRPTLTESKLITLLASGYTSFPHYRFARFSLRNYPHIDLQYADISRVEELSWVILQFDCTGCQIAADLSGKNLERVRLSKAKLTGSTFQGAKLSGALLNGADCQGVNFSYAELHEVNAVEARFDNAQFHEAVSRGGNFYKASFNGAATTRFFVNSSVGTNNDFYNTLLNVEEPLHLSQTQVYSQSSLRVAGNRLGTMVDRFYQDLPKTTKVMLDIIVVLGLLLAVAKVKEAESQGSFIKGDDVRATEVLIAPEE